MTTWADIIEIKLKRFNTQIQAEIQQSENRRKAEIEQPKKKKGKGCFFYMSLLVLLLIGLTFLPESDKSAAAAFDGFTIGQEIVYQKSMGDVKLFQLGEKRLNKREQKENNYEKETAPKFANTNTISEKYFVDNKTDNIGKVLDTIPMTDGHLWLKVKLDKNIYKKPIDFDIISDDFNVKLKLESSDLLAGNLSNDIYIPLCNIKD